MKINVTTLVSDEERERRKALRDGATQQVGTLRPEKVKPHAQAYQAEPGHGRARIQSQEKID